MTSLLIYLDNLKDEREALQKELTQVEGYFYFLRNNADFTTDFEAEQDLYEMTVEIADITERILEIESIIEGYKEEPSLEAYIEGL